MTHLNLEMLIILETPVTKLLIVSQLETIIQARHSILNKTLRYSAALTASISWANQTSLSKWRHNGNWRVQNLVLVAILIWLTKLSLEAIWKYRNRQLNNRRKEWILRWILKLCIRIMRVKVSNIFHNLQMYIIEWRLDLGARLATVLRNQHNKVYTLKPNILNKFLNKQVLSAQFSTTVPRVTTTPAPK